MKKIFIALLLLSAWTSVVCAQYYRSASRQLTHYVGFSVGGGEANNFLKDPAFAAKIGGAGNAMLNYELCYSKLFFSLGAGVNFQHTQNCSASFMDTRDAQDIEGEAFTCQYRFTDYLEKTNALMFAAQLMVGYQVFSPLYLAAGVKIKAPVMTDYVATADLQVTGFYERWAASSIVNRPDYGFYPKDAYSYSGKASKMSALVAPTIEIGAVVPMGKKCLLRAGLYADYGFALGSRPTVQLVDYSHVDLNPASQSQADLRQNIVFRSVFDSKVAGAYSNFEIGLRATFLFDVTVHNEPCHCVRK